MIMETYNSIEVAKQLVKDGKISQEIAETIFPELKENEDEKIRKAVKHLVNSTKERHFGIDNYDGVKWIDILSWLEKQGEQKPVWSEEDDINLGKAIWYVENPAPMVVKGSMLVEWLKSLKDRVQPQTKQEWSEEDEANLQFAIDDFQFCADNNQFPVVCNTEKHKEVLASLKSLKERYTWKPSDEQMKILQYLCETSSHPKKVIPTLESLYNDLKKLKG